MAVAAVRAHQVCEFQFYARRGPKSGTILRQVGVVRPDRVALLGQAVRPGKVGPRGQAVPPGEVALLPRAVIPVGTVLLRGAAQLIGTIHRGGAVLPGGAALGGNLTPRDELATREIPVCRGELVAFSFVYWGKHLPNWSSVIGSKSGSSSSGTKGSS